MAQTLKIDKIQFERNRPRRTEPSGMLNAFLYSGQSVMEFVNIGRGQTSGPCKKDPEAKERDGQPEQIPNEDDLMAALAESMDELTDAKTVEDALVYKALGAEA